MTNHAPIAPPPVPSESPPPSPFATIRMSEDAAVMLNLLGDPLASVIADGAPVVVIDLSAVAHLSSMGIGVILAIRRAVTGYGGELKLRGTRPEVWDLFRRTGIDVLFD